MFDPVWSQKIHGPHGLELLHVLRGPMQVSAGNRVTAAGAGDLIVIPSRVKHRDEFNPREDVEVFFCTMDWAHEDDFLRAFGRPRRPLLVPLRHHDVSSILEDLRMDWAHDPDTDRAIAGARLMTLLMLIHRDASGAKRPSQKSAQQAQTKQRLLLEQARDYIQRHYAEHLSLDAIAAALKVSPYYLSRVFRQESKFTLFAFLNEVRMQKARILLSDGRKNAAETAYAVGFDDPHYFSKVFQRHHGCPPSDFIIRQQKADVQPSRRPRPAAPGAA